MEAMGLASRDDGRVDPLPTKPASTARLAFNRLEHRALTNLVNDPSGSTVAAAQERATALAGDDRDGVRVRALARAAALAESHHQQLSLLLVTAIRTRDFDSAKALDRLLTGSNRRYCELMEQLGREGHRARSQPVFVVAAANQFNLDLGEPHER